MRYHDWSGFKRWTFPIRRNSSLRLGNLLKPQLLLRCYPNACVCAARPRFSPQMQFSAFWQCNISISEVCSDGAGAKGHTFCETAFKSPGSQSVALQCSPRPSVTCCDSSLSSWSLLHIACLSLSSNSDSFLSRSLSLCAVCGQTCKRDDATLAVNGSVWLSFSSSPSVSQFSWACRCSPSYTHNKKNLKSATQPLIHVV